MATDTTQQADSATIGIVGLGSMGNGMAQSLLRGGFRVFGIDLAQVQRDAAEAVGVELVNDLSALCEKTDVILLSLPMAKHVEAVITGEGGLLGAAQAHSLIIDTSTSEPDVRVNLQRC